MPEVGRVVLATSGRDAGAIFVVVAVCGGRCCIANGRQRKLQSPKKKNPRHLRMTSEQLEPEQYATDCRLRRVLREAGHRIDDNQS